jgi:hypothetical protein
MKRARKPAIMDTARRLTLGLELVLAAWGATPTGAATAVFSELNYHPVDGTNGVDGGEYEFIELYNADTNAVTLTSNSFTKGIAYTFTNATLLEPGAYLVVVKNRAAFTNRYPGVTNIASGSYTGSLDNAGEKVTLKDPLGTTVFSATYGTQPPWPAWPDGQGSTLVLKDPNGDPDDPANWQANGQFNGTPGRGGITLTNDIAINEVLSHTDPPQEDAIELRNLTTNAVNIAGWYLSDQAEVRNKYRITNTLVPAGGYIVLYEYQFNTNALFDTNNLPFEFSSAYGDSAFLTAADAQSNLTRIVDCVSFEAAENGVSFGRYPDGTGDWVTLRHVTLGTTNPPTLTEFRKGKGAPNSLPKVGPVVISEIMYHPPNDNWDEEFIELLNVTNSAVPLYDPAHPSNTWKLTTAVEFSFPTNVSLPPAGRLVVAGTTNLAAFRQVYGLSTNIPIYSAWTGRLNNAGDSVRLYKPDAPQADTNFTPYILVDRIDYGDAAPWPKAPDGYGPSLERLSATNYGNTAANWFAGAPGGSPGAAPLGGFVNPAIAPTNPAAAQAITVTVSVVAQALPTQVVVRTVINGVATNRLMNDGGTNGDVVAGDQIYTAVIPGQANGTWVYYGFQGYMPTGGLFSLPSTRERFISAPPLVLTTSGDGFLTAVEPSATWTSYETRDLASDPNAFSLYLYGSGEVLIDDISIVNTSGVEHVQNGSFNSTLAGTWTLSGNHNASYRETLPDEGSNKVLHVVSVGYGVAGSDCVRQTLSPNMTVDAPATLRFRARTTSRLEDQWFWFAAGTPAPDVLINEIMYHPDQTNELPFEYVELYNPATNAVDLSGGRLDGVAFIIPTGTVVGATNYLVLCADTNTIRSAYGITKVAGNWPGQLKNSGDALALDNVFGRELDRVEYSDNEPWPSAADGYGPSLERINAAWIGNTSVNWATATVTTNWQQVAWTGQIAKANTGIRFYLDFDGKCWIDDVSIKANGSGPELVTNGSFESGMTGWTATNSHSQSRAESGMGRTNNAALALVGSNCSGSRPKAGGYLREVGGLPGSGAWAKVRRC